MALIGVKHVDLHGRDVGHCLVDIVLLKQSTVTTALHNQSDTFIYLEIAEHSVSLRARLRRLLVVLERLQPTRIAHQKLLTFTSHLWVPGGGSSWSFAQELPEASPLAVWLFAHVWLFLEWLFAHVSRRSATGKS